MATTNYSLPVFTSTDSIDLIGVYNAAMQIIDTKLKSIDEQVAAVEVVKDYLRNKKAVMYGDSTAALGPTYSSMITSLCGMQITNRAISGTEKKKSIERRNISMDFFAMGEYPLERGMV